MRMLELAANNREAASRKGARSTPTSAHEVDVPIEGVELDTNIEEDSYSVCPLPRREGKAYARWTIATGGAAIILDDFERRSSRGLRRLEGGFFSHAFSP
jgi:hypothetical protein